MSKIKCAVNSNGKNKQHPQRLAKGWKNVWMTADELSKWIMQGYSWCATHFVRGHRCAANARGSNVIVFDFDGEVQLADFWATDVAKEWCSFTYTSASSTDQVNRFRAVFQLGGPAINTAWDHKCIYKFIADRVAKELAIEIKDNCGEKPERLWYGNDKTSITFNDDAHVPASVVASIDIPEEPTYKRYGSEDITDIDIERARYVLRHLLRPSEDGEYNEYFVSVMMAAAGIGFAVADAWVDWVARGHHGDKPDNLNPELKWRGIDAGRGVAGLFRIAKEQDINWYKKLPAHLKNNANTNNFTSETVMLEAILAQRCCAPRSLFITAS